jgi:hypothetical protein
MVPELLVLNQAISPNYKGSISFELITHTQETVEVAETMAKSLTPKLEKILTEAGCYFERAGKGDHDIGYSPILVQSDYRKALRC